MVGGRRFDVKHFICILCSIWRPHVQSFAVNSPYRISREASVMSMFESDLADAAAEAETDPSSYEETTTLSTNVRETPCVRICRYNADFFGGAVCIGCFREAFEIGNWASFSSQERLYALQDALDRLDSVGHEGNDHFEGSIDRNELEAMVAYYRTQK
jgi:predicted Fe-S protein YdhL (DUF1289 family)